MCFVKKSCRYFFPRNYLACPKFGFNIFFHYFGLKPIYHFVDTFRLFNGEGGAGILMIYLGSSLQAAGWGDNRGR